MDWEIRQTRTLFQLFVFHSKYRMFQQVQLAVEQDPSRDWVVPLTQGCEVTHPSWQDVPLQIPIDNSLPVGDGLGVLCGKLHWSTVRVWKMAVSWDFHTFTVLGASSRVPSLVYGAAGPISWPVKCIKAWNIMVVHPAKVVLPVSILIYCFNIPLFLSTNSATRRL